MRYLWILCLLTACTHSPDQQVFDEPAQQEVQQAVRQMLHAYHAAIEKEGLMAEFAFLDSSEQFFWAPPGYASAIDYDSVRAVLSENAPNMREIHFSWEQLTIIPLAPDIATYHGIVSGNMQDQSGEDHPVYMLESGTLILREDGWKLLSGQSINLERTQ